MNNKKIRLLGIIAILVFVLGIYFSSLIHDSKALKQLKKSETETKQNQLIINDKSQELEIKLQQVKMYDAQNHKKTSTISNTANTHCISLDFVELYNQQTTEYEKILSTKHIDKMY